MVWNEYVSMTLKEITKYLNCQVFCTGEGSILKFEMAIRRPIGWMWQASKNLKASPMWKIVHFATFQN
jgi:hypothetical protein